MKNEIVGTRIGIYDVLYECEHKSKDGHKLYHVKCSMCGHENDMLKSHIGRATSCKHQEKKLTEIIEIKKCLNCEKEIPANGISPTEYKERKFCSLNCSATYNNKLKGKKQFCLNCGEPLKSYQTKYCSGKCQREYQQKQWEEKWLSGEINGFNKDERWGRIPRRIKTYLFKKYDSKCARCRWGETNPYSNTIPLEVEHIDGNYKNNRPENLTLLCPNCHSLTATYRGLNIGHGRGKTWRLITEDEDTDNSVAS